MEDGAGDGEPLLHTVGERANAAVGAVEQADLVQSSVDPAVGAIEAVEAGVKLQIFAAGKVVVQHGLMTYKTDQTPG